MNTLRLIGALVACTAMILGGTGCTELGGAYREGATDSASRGKIMRVTMTPASLGLKRLQYHASAYPGVERFLRGRGYPDYIIEDPGVTSRKIILFYLKQNQAYLISIKSSFGGARWTVSGPEPIGKKTRALFIAMNQMQEAAAGLVEEAKKGGN